MFRRTVIAWTVVLPPQIASFEFTKQEAKGAVWNYYHQRWFGTSPEYIEIAEPKSKFLPFYACDGKVAGSFSAEIERHTTHTDAKGKTHTRSYWSFVGNFTLEHVFRPNSTCIYAGFKYNRKHLSVACCDKVLTEMHAPHKADLEGHKIHLFEMSTTQVRGEVLDHISAELDAAAKREVRKHIWNSAANLRIHWTSRTVILKKLQPMYCPVFVVTIGYDDRKYKCFMSGITTAVNGPYIVNALLVSRVVAVLAYAAALVFIPQKPIAIAAGFVAAGVGSYCGNWGARRLPRWMRDWEKTRREKRKKADENAALGGDDASRAIPINPFSSTFETSSFRFGESTDAEDDELPRSGSAQDMGRVPADPKGYYKILQLRGTEPKEEVQTQYRRLMLKFHPDTSGDRSTINQDRVSKINDAYRVIRDPRRRAEYDQIC